MKLKDFMNQIKEFSEDMRGDLLKEAIKSGMFDDGKTSTMLDSDKKDYKKKIADLKQALSEYQIMFNNIHPIDDYIPLYTVLSDNGLVHQHKPVQEAFDIVESAGFKICDFSEVRKIAGNN